MLLIKKHNIKVLTLFSQYIIFWEVVMIDNKIKVVSLKWIDECNIIIGQSHFIKTVEDIAEIMAGYVPNAQYGFAFNEASEPCLVRTTGNNEKLIEEAVKCALDVGAGHAFYLILKKEQ